MNNSYALILTLLLLTCSLQAGTTMFATKRVKGMAEYLSLNQLDTLKPGICENYYYKGHPLIIRVNDWGEIEHVGLKLFSMSMRKVYPSPVYDFLERYLLEKNASPSDTEEGVKMQWDKVHFSIGSPSTALQLDSTAEFVDNHVDLKVYRVAWVVNDKVVLQMSFDMDYQLMSGCTEIELERSFMKSLGRFESTQYISQRKVSFTKQGDEFIRKGDFFITPLVRNELYYTRKKGNWELVMSAKRPSQSVANIMLSANVDDSIKLHLIMDQYGYKKDTLMTTYRQFIQLCLKEGCTPYYGMKEKSNDTYYGTVFLVNRQGGYLHLLSAAIPVDIIDAPQKVTIEGKLYTYIPLFNVSDKILNPQNYKSINN